MTAQDNHAGHWSRPLRLLHLLLAVGVTAQLILGSTMHSPHAGRSDTLGFEIHEILGFTLFLLIILHWLWSFTHPDEGLRHLFPWTRAGLRNVMMEFWQGARYLRLPAGGPINNGGLSGFVHGLGLLAVTGMVLTGAVFYLSRMAGAGPDVLEIIKDVHDTLAVITWIYWGGHLAVTMLHSLLRHPTFMRIFSLFD